MWLFVAALWLFVFFLWYLLKTSFEDVFPAEATSVEEYLQQVLPFLDGFLKFTIFIDWFSWPWLTVMMCGVVFSFSFLRFMKWLWYQLYRKPKRITFEALMTIWWKSWRFVFWLTIFQCWIILSKLLHSKIDKLVVGWNRGVYFVLSYLIIVYTDCTIMQLAIEGGFCWLDDLLVDMLERCVCWLSKFWMWLWNDRRIGEKKNVTSFRALAEYQCYLKRIWLIQTERLMLVT